MAKIPDKAEHQRRFAGLEMIERRAIIKAVNRGTVVAERKHAPLAVGVARRQQRFWRIAWVMGPVVGAVGAIGGGELVPALINAAVATTVLLAMSWFWYSRASRAEALNLELASSRGRDRDRTATGADEPSAGQRFRSHLPGGSSRRAEPGGDHADDDGDDDGQVPQAHARQTPATNPPPGQRPYKPRGRKRR